MLTKLLSGDDPSYKGTKDPPEWRALLLIDPQRRQHILDNAGQWFFNDQWISSIEIFLDQLFETLKNACQHAHGTRKEALKTQD